MMENWRPENWDAAEIARPIKQAEPVGRWVSQLDVNLVEAGADFMLEKLKVTGKYCRLHRTVQPEGYKQPIRAPGWKVFIPEVKRIELE